MRRLHAPRFEAGRRLAALGSSKRAGCTDVLLNGDQRILSRTETTLSFKTTAANSSQTTGASAMFAPLGWDRPFASTASQVAFRSPAAFRRSGVVRQLRVTPQRQVGDR